MARFKDREKALVLRKKGMSYSQIMKELKVGKSTLSCWLKDYPLSSQRIKELRDFNEQRIEKCRETKKKKKTKRLNEVCDKQKEYLFPFTDKEFYLAGLFLYWGEGTKSKEAHLSISNTNPAILKFFIDWVVKSLSFPKNKLKVYLHLYQDMIIIEEIKFWSKCLSIPRTQFNKPYIKKNEASGVIHKGGFGHGTCNVSLGNAKLSEKVLMGLKVIEEYYNQMGV